MAFVLSNRKLVMKQTGGSKSINNLKETIEVSKLEKMATSLATLVNKEVNAFEVQEIHKYEE